MKITWIGPEVVLRQIGEWSWRNGDSQEIEDTAAVSDLLTLPTDRFTVAEDDPLAQLVGSEHAESLAVAGICTVPSLAALSEEEVRALAEWVGVKEKELAGWVAAATNRAGLTASIELED